MIRGSRMLERKGRSRWWKYLAHAHVEFLELLAKLLVLGRIVNQGISSIKDDIRLCEAQKSLTAMLYHISHALIRL